jgi:hypothetical protein
MAELGKFLKPILPAGFVPSQFAMLWKGILLR